MSTFNLYKLGRYGWFHITSIRSSNLKEAIQDLKKNFTIKGLGTNKIGTHKITGL